MNRKALQKLSYGVYLVTTSYNGKPYGCVANSAMQITSAPAQIAGEIFFDLGFGRVCKFVLHSEDVHNKARITEATLFATLVGKIRTELLRTVLYAL